MIHAMVLLKVNRERINEVALALEGLDGVTEVYTVAGQYDLVAMLRAGDDNLFARAVTEGLLKIEGITASETLIAVKVHSRFDLEKIFTQE